MKRIRKHRLNIFDPRIDKIFSKPVDMREFSRFLENYPVVYPKSFLSAVCYASSPDQLFCRPGIPECRFSASRQPTLTIAF